MSFLPQTYGACLQAFFARASGGMRLGTGYMAELLKALGEPHRRLKVVHVAGTNGKGTTSFTMAQGLEAMGLRVGLYTSPHLLRFAERIQINQRAIDDALVQDMYQRLCRIEPKLSRPFTFFEGATAMACLAFLHHKVDVAVLEAGLGGRLDATRLGHGACALMTVITPIALDHQATLGRSVAAIAAEKAGIIAVGRPVISARQPTGAYAVLKGAATARGAPFFSVGRSVASQRPSMPQQPFVPAFMRDNYQLADDALDLLAQHLECRPKRRQATHPKNHRRDTWPGRYQRVATPSNKPNVIVDGGHNLAGMKALQGAVVADPSLKAHKRHLIFSALGGKDVAAMLSMLRPWVDTTVVCLTQARRAQSAEGLATLGPQEHIFSGFAAAWRAICKVASKQDTVIVAGSLYLVADALAYLTSAGRDPPLAWESLPFAK